MLGRDVKPTFGGDLLPTFRNQRHHVGPDTQRNSEHLSRRRHLKIEAGTNGLTQQFDVPILDMATVFPQMHRDAVSPAELGKHGHGNRIGFNRSARLTHIGDVIDIDAETGHDDIEDDADPMQRGASAVSSQGQKISVTVPVALATRESALQVGIDPFWAPLAMLVTQDLALKLQFRERLVLQHHNLPRSGPVLLAPTHRARWDALMLPMAAGRRITGRDCRFMVTTTEMSGLQGWFLQRLGCFPVDQRRPSLTTLRLAIDLLADGQQLVMFPEGRIQRQDQPIHLHQGLVRLAGLAQSRGVQVPVVPVGLGYSQTPPRPFSRAAICFGEPINVPQDQGKEARIRFNQALAQQMHTAEQAAREAVGRPLQCL